MSSDVHMAQIMTLFARVLLQHAEVVSGKSASRDIQHGDGDGGLRQLADEEKTNRTIGIMENHIRLMQETADHMARTKAAEINF